MKSLEYIIQKTLSSIIAEQAPAAPTAKETDNAPSDAENSPFTPAEEKFLGKFDAYGTRHIGIIYSLSDIGIREFITRSGANLNISPDILVSLLRKKAIKIVPYTGFGRNDDYTIELKLSLDDVKGLGSEDKAKAEAGSGASGAPAGGEAPMPPSPAGPGPEVAWVIPYGELIKESTKIAKQLITEKSKDKTKSKIQADKSRIMKRLPKGYINQLERIIDMIGKKTHNSNEKQRMVADILDNLSVNLNLSDKQIRKSFEFFKNQKRLQESINLSEADPGQPYKFSPAIKAYLDNAAKFWIEIDAALSGWNWQEDMVYAAVKQFVKSKLHAVYIDAFGILLKRATSPEDIIADKALNASNPGWASLDIPIETNSGVVYTLKQLFQDDQLKKQLWDETTGYFGFGSPEYKSIDKILKDRAVGRFFNNDVESVGLQYAPAYSTTEVYTIVNKLLEPFKTDDYKKQARNKTIATQSKAVKSKIEKNRKVYASEGMPETPLQSIHNINGVRVDYQGTWIDKNNKPYVWFKTTGAASTYRLYADGTAIYNGNTYKFIIGTTKTGVDMIRLISK
jgi:hypothetical protein